MALCTIWAMIRQPSTIARPKSALTIAPFAPSIWRGLPPADMYLNPPHIRKKAQTVAATPSPMLRRWVNRLLIASTFGVLLFNDSLVGAGSAPHRFASTWDRGTAAAHGPGRRRRTDRRVRGA